MGFCPGGQGSFAWETWKFSICVQTSLKRGVAKKNFFWEFDCFKWCLFKMIAWLKEKMESSGTLPWRNYILFKERDSSIFILFKLSALMWMFLPERCGRQKALPNQGPPHPWVYSFTEGNKVIFQQRNWDKHWENMCCCSAHHSTVPAVQM